MLASSSKSDLPVPHEDDEIGLLLKEERDFAALLVASHYAGLPSMPSEDVKLFQQGPGRYRIPKAASHTELYLKNYLAQYAAARGHPRRARRVLLRAAWEKPEAAGRPDLEEAAQRLGHLVDELQKQTPLDTVRGHEGDAARGLFQRFRSPTVITDSKDAFFFRERSRWPLLDNMNVALISIYMLLTHDVSTALEGGAWIRLSVDRPGRPSLALDVVEELRPGMQIVWPLSMINRRQITGRTRTTECRAVEMDDATRKEVLLAYQKRKLEEISHPFRKERVAFGIVPHAQAMLLARHLRGDLEGDSSFLWR